MTASADTLYLPVPSTYRSTFENFKRPRKYGMERQHLEQHRIYRMPRYDQQRLTYGVHGYTSSHPTIGSIIDIRV